MKVWLWENCERWVVGRGEWGGGTAAECSYSSFRMKRKKWGLVVIGGGGGGGGVRRWMGEAWRAERGLTVWFLSLVRQNPFPPTTLTPFCVFIWSLLLIFFFSTSEMPIFFCKSWTLTNRRAGQLRQSRSRPVCRVNTMYGAARTHRPFAPV